MWDTWENFVGDVMAKYYDVITFILKYLYLKKGTQKELKALEIMY